MTILKFKNLMTDIIKEKKTRESILHAAREVFVEKGPNGARMQEIADRAGINKALLHYYFSNKENLFDTIFKEAFSLFWPKVNQEVMRNAPLNIFMKAMVTTYLDMLMQRPYLAIFILNELQSNPERLERLIKESGFDPQLLITKIEVEIAAGHCQPFNPKEIIINIISLSIFPFVSRPLVQRVWYDNDPEQFRQFIIERRESLIKFIENAIFISH